LRGRGRPKINPADCANLTPPTSVAFQSHCNHSIGHPSMGSSLNARLVGNHKAGKATAVKICAEQQIASASVSSLEAQAAGYLAN
jgi:hypothetical protein